MPYGAEHAELYEKVFLSRGKDFEAEAGSVAGLVRSRFPAAGSLLDVACGTGAHLEAFQRLFEEVAGVEPADGMRERAAARLPGVAVHGDDMRDFDLGRTFDAVVCLGNSVACMPDRADLDAAIARMADHLVTGGVLVVEPWWFPGDFIDGYVDGHVLRDGDRVVSRITRSVRDGDRTRMEVRFTVADATGIRDFTEELTVTLFEREDYVAAFERAGCAVELVAPLRLDAGRPNGPGLFTGVRK
ncbi:class I SAM-dependent methyltransferase [Lentzea sp. PSKA42]|uniref:Class I SAM-dependent methyltransferase n=1 Tax=Lentzea indica TaxID=2604800 RepID=A0ABX1FUE7_9PSEU|nr:class I SAM-dependent methyltransferase [Lentzea indica]NKE62658.1 class I SAM-dependent methyltransferase [Lentzea indica]